MFTRRRLLVGAVALVLVAWGVAVAMILLGAIDDLEAGRDAAMEARDGLDFEGISDRTPLPPLREAAQHFADADQATSHFLLAPVKFVPIVGRQLRSVEALSGAAAEASAAAADGLEAVGAALDKENGDGASRLDQIISLSVAAETTHRRLAAIDDLGPSKGLFGPLADARADLEDELDEATQALADASAGSNAARALLEGPRKYLVMAANNAEMRAGSGMWLSAGILETVQGELRLGDMSTLTDTHMQPGPGDVPAEAISPDMESRWGWAKPAEDWRNLMLSPDFPSSARLAAAMWQSLEGEPVDGVLAIDPIALAAVIRATGPVEIDGQVFTADDVAAELLHDQYEQFGDSPVETVARRDYLGRLAQAAFGALDSGSWDPGVLARELAEAVRGRHLMAWARSDDENAGWRAAHMDGALEGNDLAVSLLNTSATKTDWFLDSSVDVEIQPAGDETEVVLHVKVKNDVPDDEPLYVAGPTEALEGILGPGDHRGILAVNVPGAARGLAIDGVERPPVFGTDGPTRVVGTEVVVRRGEEQTFVVRFRLPGNKGRIRVSPSARSSLVEWSSPQGSWQDTGQHTLNW